MPLTLSDQKQLGNRSHTLPSVPLLVTCAPSPTPQIAEIKVAVAQMACRVLDRAIQVHGAMGVSQDSPLPHWFAGARSLRIADGPDIVHLETVAKQELKEKAKL